LLICFVTIFARQKYRQNNFCFHIIALGVAQATNISPFQLWAMPKAGISRPFRALILLNYYYENINDIFCYRRYFQWGRGG